MQVLLLEKASMSEKITEIYHHKHLKSRSGQVSISLNEHYNNKQKSDIFF